MTQGFRVAGVCAGIKRNKEAKDVALIVSDRPCAAAGVFTKNLVRAAPVFTDLDHLALSGTTIRAVIVNAGCANACTGAQGLENAKAMCREVAAKVGCREQEVLVMSTGVIGVQLPMEKVRAGITSAHEALASGTWEDAAQAIMTTDTKPKLFTKTLRLKGGEVSITGIAKGAGMIAPNMATMLGLVVTDAVLPADLCRTLLTQVNETTFNRIVIDGDMSTNDTLLFLSNGASKVALADESDLSLFSRAFSDLCRELAQAIVRDGEGVTKFITLRVCGASSQADAHTIANTIATSPLVKTAFYGGDANWGRIMAAAGRSGIIFSSDLARLFIESGERYQLSQESLLLFENGMPTAYDEQKAGKIFAGSEVTVTLDLGNPNGVISTEEAVVWTCDLSHDYVDINGHYRT